MNGKNIIENEHASILTKGNNASSNLNGGLHQSGTPRSRKALLNSRGNSSGVNQGASTNNG